MKIVDYFLDFRIEYNIVNVKRICIKKKTQNQINAACITPGSVTRGLVEARVVKNMRPFSKLTISYYDRGPRHTQTALIDTI